MIILGQVPAGLEPPTGTKNMKKRPLKLFSLIKDPACTKPESAPDPMFPALTGNFNLGEINLNQT